jgi:hypothetical protein
MCHFSLRLEATDTYVFAEITLIKRSSEPYMKLTLAASKVKCLSMQMEIFYLPKNFSN